MNNKTKNVLKMAILLSVLVLTTIIVNVTRHKELRPETYQPNKVFSITVSEEKWDESMMPKGRRSPKGVLYNPEK